MGENPDNGLFNDILMGIIYERQPFEKWKLMPIAWVGTSKPIKNLSKSSLFSANRCHVLPLWIVTPNRMLKCGDQWIHSDKNRLYSQCVCRYFYLILLLLSRSLTFITFCLHFCAISVTVDEEGSIRKPSSVSQITISPIAKR